MVVYINGAEYWQGRATPDGVVVGASDECVIIRPYEGGKLTLIEGCSRIRVRKGAKAYPNAVAVDGQNRPLSAEAVEIVQRQQAAHPKSDFIFLNDDGAPYSAVALRQRLERWCRRAKVPIMPPYALRHVFGTRQASNGTNQAILAQLMGHSNLQTATRYVVNCDEAHIKAVDEMARRIMPIIQKARNNLSKAS